MWVRVRVRVGVWLWVWVWVWVWCANTQTKKQKKKKKELRGPGIEPGSTAWKAAMLTITPAALSLLILVLIVSILEEL